MIHTPATRFQPEAITSVRYPPLPRTVIEVAQLLASGSNDTTRLSRVVNLDPVVAAAVLRRVNSARIGLREHVADIGVAVFLLGFAEVCNIVMTEGLLKLRAIVRSDEQVHLFEGIMAMSIGAASFADRIARRLDLPQASTAFTSGLLHTVGRLVLLYIRPDDYEALWITGGLTAGPPPEAERMIFGLDHQELALKAGLHWNLPADVIDLIANYTEPDNLAAYQTYELALTLNLGVSAAVSVCSLSDGFVAFDPPPSLYTLAARVNYSVDELSGIIDEHTSAVKLLVSEVISNPAEEAG